MNFFFCLTFSFDSERIRVPPSTPPLHIFFQLFLRLLLLLCFIFLLGLNFNTLHDYFMIVCVRAGVGVFFVFVAEMLPSFEAAATARSLPPAPTLLIVSEVVSLPQSIWATIFSISIQWWRNKTSGKWKKCTRWIQNNNKMMKKQWEKTIRSMYSVQAKD